MGCNVSRLEHWFARGLCSVPGKSKLKRNRGCQGHGG